MKNSASPIFTSSCWPISVGKSVCFMSVCRYVCLSVCPSFTLSFIFISVFSSPMLSLIDHIEPFNGYQVLCYSRYMVTKRYMVSGSICLNSFIKVELQLV